MVKSNVALVIAIAAIITKYLMLGAILDGILKKTIHYAALAGLTVSFGTLSFPSTSHSCFRAQDRVE